MSPLPLGILSASISGGFEYWLAIQQTGGQNRGQVNVGADGTIYTTYETGTTALNTDSTLLWSKNTTNVLPYGGCYYKDGVGLVVSGQWNGELGWSKFTTAGAYDYSRWTSRSGTWYDATIAGDGNYYLAGGYSYNGNQAGLIKFNSSGTYQWDYGYQNVGQIATGIAHDSLDQIYFCYAMYNTNSGNVDQALTKVDQTGTEVWSRRWQPVNSGGANHPGLFITSDDKIFMYGSSSNSSQAYTHFVELNTSGNFVSSAGLNVGQSSKVGMWVDTNGDRYLASGTGSGAFWIFKLNSSNVLQWQRQFTGTTFGGAGFEGAYLTGDANAIYFSNTIVHNGQSRLFVGKLPKDGAFTGSYSLGSTTVTCAASSATLTTGVMATRTNFTMSRSNFGFPQYTPADTVTTNTPTFLADGF